MRNTGLRIGELTSLPMNCVRQDELGNTSPALPQLDAEAMLTDVIRWVQKRTLRDADSRKRALALVKRLRRLREELTDL